MGTTHAANVFRALDRELWLVTAAAGGRRGGLIATFVNKASIVPERPRVVVGIAKQHHTWGLIEASGALALHLLSEEQLEWVWRFGLASGRDVDKFAGLAMRTGTSGAPIVTEAPGWLDCRVEARLDTGDRTVYLAEVLDAQAPGPGTLLTVHRMIELAGEAERAELQRQMTRDSAVDASAIDDWRHEHGRVTADRDLHPDPEPGGPGLA